MTPEERITHIKKRWEDAKATYDRGDLVATGTLLWAFEDIPWLISQIPEWLDIETAPKDGTKVDLWVRHEASCKSFRVPNCYFEHGKWQSWIQIQRGEYPTHWRSIPDPPVPVTDPGT